MARDLDDVHDGDAEVGPTLIVGLVVMVLTIAAALGLLFVDLKTGAAVDRGEPPAPFVVVWTPATYSPPPL